MDNYTETVAVNGYTLVPINKHNFEKEKNDLRKFSEKLPSKISFTPVEVDGGLFGWGDHQVTGLEMNNFIGNVQEKFIDFNNIIRDVYKAFKDVYEVLNVLDGEYLTGIAKNSESAFYASQQAIKAQQDIMETVGNLKKTVEKLCELQKEVKRVNGVLAEVQLNVNNVKGGSKQLAEDISIIKKYQSKLKSYTHLDDIDKIWSDFGKQKEELRDIHKWEDDISKQTKQLAIIINKLQVFCSKLESYEHLGDVDNMWSDVAGHKAELTEFHLQVDHFIESTNQATELIKQDITALQQYRSKLEAYKHLGDVDNMWSDLNGQKTDLANFHQQVDGFIESANKATGSIQKDIAALQQYRSKLETYKHLSDVDDMWRDLNGHKTDLANFHQHVDGFMESANKATGIIQKDITILQQYRSKLETYVHLGDVDNMWEDVEGHRAELTNLQQQVANYISEAHATQAEIKDSIQRIEEANTSAHLKYEKRIRIAYIMGGSAISLLIINYILQLLGIL